MKLITFLSSSLPLFFLHIIGITFSSIYPGCIATSELFREKRKWFRIIFPFFMKYVTKGFVSEMEAGERLAEVCIFIYIYIYIYICIYIYIYLNIQIYLYV
jgi:hypothetical protein